MGGRFLRILRIFLGIKCFVWVLFGLGFYFETSYESVVRAFADI